MLANPAGAVELGELVVESTLGQPLAASIAFALGPNEQLADRCVYLRAGAPAADLPAVTRARVAVEGSRIVLRGGTALREPMMSLQLVVDCPYTAKLRRDYMLMLNPPLRGAELPLERPAAAGRAAATRRASAPDTAAATRREARPAPVTRQGDAVQPQIAAGSDYRVQPGDTLSEIVSRIENRRVGLWPAIESVFAENPQAFRDGNVDRLIAGATLRIPHGVSGDAELPLERPTAAGRAYAGVAEAAGGPTAIERGPAASRSPADGQPSGAAVTRTVATIEPAADTAAVTPAPAVAPQPTANATQPDLPVATSSPVRKSVALGPQVPDVAEQLPIAGDAAAADTVAARPRGEPIPLADVGDSPAQSWLVWLGGSGIALFLALLVFGRRLRERFGTRLDNADDHGETRVNEALRNRRSTDGAALTPASQSGLQRRLGVAAAGGIVGSRQDDTDFDTGQDAGAALDFSFESSGEYRNDLDFIVEEQRPGDAGDALSGHFEVTQEEPSLPNMEPADRSPTADMKTAELPAALRPDANRDTIEVQALDSKPRQNAGLDLTSEFDYHVLERDYEHELSATQVLNQEIEQAARELQDRLGSEDDSGVISVAADLEGTAEMTAEMPRDMVPAESIAGNESLENPDRLDETEVTEAALDDALTSKLPDSDETVEMDPDATVERRSKTG